MISHGCACRNTVFYLLFCFGICFGQLLSPQENIQDSSRIEAAYFEAMTRADDESFANQFEYPFLVLLDIAQREHYDKLPDISQKKDFISLYWKINNPNPLLPENEQLNVFLARCTYVQTNFLTSRPPYFDDRGKYFLKYGEPENRFQQKGETKFVQLFANPYVYNWICDNTGLTARFKDKKIKNAREVGGKIPRYYSVETNETWIYPPEDNDPDKVLIVHFIQRGEGFQEVDRIDDFITDPGPLGNRMWYWSDLMKERAMALGVKPFSDMTREIHEFEEIIHTVAYGRLSALHAYRDKKLTPLFESYVAKPAIKLYDKKITNESTVQWAKHQNPPSMFRDGITPNTIIFDPDIAQFRGSSGRTRIECSLLAPMKNNLEQNLRMDTLNIDFACLFEDHLANPQITDTWTNRIPVNVTTQSGLENSIGYTSISAQPQKGQITFQVKDLDTRRLGYQKQSISIRDFTGSFLMISDIQLLSEVTDPELKKSLPILNKQGRDVVPYPLPGIQPSWQVFCYFEIYNMLGGFPSGEYVVELNVSRLRGRGILNKLTDWMSDKDKTSVGLAHTRIADEDTAHELIGIDFSNLKRGEYQFEITVKDALNENHQASAQKNIMIER